MKAGVAVDFADDRGEATLTYTATNAVTAVFFSAFLGLLALLPFALAIAAIANARIDLALAFFAVTAAAVWAIRHFVWRPKIYRIHFGETGLTVSGQFFDYDDIASFGVGEAGGDAYDPASMPVPRNSVSGPHLYIVLKSDPRPRPITVNMPRAQAQNLAAEFEGLFNTFASVCEL